MADPAWVAVDWLTRTLLPHWLHAAGLDSAAENLTVLPALDNPDAAAKALPPIFQAHRSAEQTSARTNVDQTAVAGWEAVALVGVDAARQIIAASAEPDVIVSVVAVEASKAVRAAARAAGAVLRERASVEARRQTDDAATRAADATWGPAWETQRAEVTDRLAALATETAEQVAALQEHAG